jgi:hypothetical protein
MNIPVNTNFSCLVTISKTVGDFIGPTHEIMHPYDPYDVRVSILTGMMGLRLDRWFLAEWIQPV